MSGFPPPVTYNPIAFSLPGTLPASATGPARYVMAGAGTLTQIHASVGTAPLGFHGGGQVSVALLVNGSSVATARIADSTNDADTVLSPPVALAAGDYITANLVSINFTSQAPADLLVEAFKVGI